MTKFLLNSAAAIFAAVALTPAGPTAAKAGPVCISDITPPGMYRSCEYHSVRQCRRDAIRGGGVCARHRYVNDGGYLDGPSYGPMLIYDRSYIAPVYYTRPYVRAL